MRRAFVSGAVVVGTFIAAAASAAERGQLGIHVGATPTRHHDALGLAPYEPDLSFSYQATDRLSLRPGFSVAHALNGWGWEVGGTALYHLRPGRKFAPYLGAGLRYHARKPYATLPLDAVGVVPFVHDDSRRYLTLSVIAGVEYSLGRRLSLFAEVEGTHRTGRHYLVDGRECAWPATGSRPGPSWG